MSELFVTRLPVYAQDLEVSAYVLQTDYSEAQEGRTQDVEQASLLVSALVRPSLLDVAGDKPVYIRLSKDMLSGDYLDLLPKERFAIVVPCEGLDAAAVDTMTAFSQKGLRFALSDFALTPETRRVLFSVKTLFVPAERDEAEVRKLRAEAKRFGIAVIATGIAEHETLKRVRALKVDGYMGDFLTKPDLFKPVTESSNRLIVYRLLDALQDPNVGIDVLENLLAKDNRLSYKLLKILNSPQYASLGRHVSSLRDLIMVMGLDPLKSWVTLIALSNIEDKPYELMVATMLRAKMGEQMAKALGVQTPEMAFMVGLLSTLDALLDREMVDVLDELPLNAGIKDALLQHAGPLGTILRDVINYEKGNWAALAGSLLAREDYRRIYTESVIWASKLCSALSV